jgi:hypothetical protein
MKAKGPSNGWELETRRILQEQLPEFDIDPHMRLANIVQGRVKFIRAMSQYEIDFTVRDKKTGAVICAIELDGPTHDTEDGRRRDANKNRWLAEAKIKLVRIRHPNEANNIRILIENQSIGEAQEPSTEYVLHENLSTQELPSWLKSDTGPHMDKWIKTVAVFFTLAFIFWFSFTSMANNQQRRVIEQAQQAQQRAMQQQALSLQKAQLEAQMHGQQNVAVPQQPKYDRLLIRAKSAKECARPDGSFDNFTITCMKDHYEMVLVNNQQ